MDERTESGLSSMAEKTTVHLSEDQILAGLTELWTYDPERESGRDVVIRLVSAVVAAGRDPASTLRT